MALVAVFMSCTMPTRARDAAPTRSSVTPLQTKHVKSTLLPVTSREHDPKDLLVPARLREKTCPIEASGIAWCPALQRYLIVSDDTGLKLDGTRHAAWLFSMNVSGTLDADPVPILHLDLLNDAEAITSGPDGSFFIATSHSPNRKGRPRPERRMLLHTALTGRALRVIGRVDLTEARDSQGRGLLSFAGLDENGRLDIEALAYNKNELYIGLKSPLTTHGGAVILRLENPVAVLRSGRLPPGALTRFTETSLRVDGPTGPAFQGLSDMIFLSDGSLIILGNSPKGMPTDGGGALWWLRNPGSKARAPTLLHRYPGLKPEGITVAADGTSLIIVFDRGQAPPWWSRWPLPR
jgi:hypothetical protein